MQFPWSRSRVTSSRSLGGSGNTAVARRGLYFPGNWLNLWVFSSASSSSSFFCRCCYYHFDSLPLPPLCTTLARSTRGYVTVQPRRKIAPCSSFCRPSLFFFLILLLLLLLPLLLLLANTFFASGAAKLRPLSAFPIAWASNACSCLRSSVWPEALISLFGSANQPVSLLDYPKQCKLRFIVHAVFPRHGMPFIANTLKPSQFIVCPWRQLQMVATGVAAAGS